MEETSGETSFRLSNPQQDDLKTISFDTSALRAFVSHSSSKSRSSQNSEKDIKLSNANKQKMQDCSKTDSEAEFIDENLLLCSSSDEEDLEIENIKHFRKMSVYDRDQKKILESIREESKVPNFFNQKVPKSHRKVIDLWNTCESTVESEQKHGTGLISSLGDPFRNNSLLTSLSSSRGTLSSRFDGYQGGKRVFSFSNSTGETRPLKETEGILQIGSESYLAKKGHRLGTLGGSFKSELQPTYKEDIEESGIPGKLESDLCMSKNLSNKVFNTNFEKRNIASDGRIKRTRGNGQQSEFDINLEKAEMLGKTTLMIRNIPNKYTQDLMLERIDRKFSNTYDFFYLPIDFKNKCNIGYAFINFVDSCYVRPFVEELNSKKWERFNSEKICNIRYARIQGKDALIAHFENSSVMNKNDRKLKPLILDPRGPGDYRLKRSSYDPKRSSDAQRSPDFSGIKY